MSALNFVRVQGSGGRGGALRSSGSRPDPTPVGSTGDPGLDRINWAGPAVSGRYGQQFMFGRVAGQAGPMGYEPGGGSDWEGTAPGGSSGPDFSPYDPTRQNLANPPDVTAETPNNPMEDYAYGRAKDYEANLAKGTNEEIQREIGRQRDEISVGMAKEGEAAIGRGADPTLFRTRALGEGARNLSNLQARLADVALGRRNEAIGTLAGAAGQAASGQRAMHFGTMAQRLADQRYQLDAAETNARLREAPYDRLLKMMDAYGRYTGLVGGGDSGGYVSSGGGIAAGRLGGFH